MSTRRQRYHKIPSTETQIKIEFGIRCPQNGKSLRKIKFKLKKAKVLRFSIIITLHYFVLSSGFGGPFPQKALTICSARGLRN
jgi:hypothetical protein